MKQRALIVGKSNDKIRTLRFHFRFEYPSYENKVINIPFNKVMVFTESSDRGFGKEIPEPKRWIGVFNMRDSEKQTMYNPWLTLWDDNGALIYNKASGDTSNHLAQIVQLNVNMDSLGTLSMSCVSKMLSRGGGIGMVYSGLSYKLVDTIYYKIDQLPSGVYYNGVIDLATYCDPLNAIPYDILNTHAISYVEYYGYEPPV